MAILRQGSWFGLPEFGVTEKISDVLGKSRTQQGGSNIWGQAPAQAPQSQAGQTLGATQPGGFIGPQLPAKQSGGGSQAAPASPAGTGQLPSGVPQEQAPGQPLTEYDISGPLNELDAAQTQAEQNLQANLGSIASQITAQQSALETGFGQVQSAQQGEIQRVKQETQGLVGGARSQAAEIERGIQSRYGGTGVGGFVSTIAQREAARQIQAYQQQLQQGVAKATQQIESARQEKETQIQQLVAQGDQMKLQAKQETQKILSDISRDKSKLQAEKAQAVAQILQNYQATVAEINRRNTAFQQQLYLVQTKAQQALTLLKERQSQSLGSVSKLQNDFQQALASGQYNLPTYTETSTGKVGRTLTPKKGDEILNPFGAGAVGDEQGQQDTGVDPLLQYINQ